MWRRVGGGVVLCGVLVVGAIYLSLRDPRIDTSVSGTASNEELHAALSPCPKTYNSWPFEVDYSMSGPEIRAQSWWRIESVGDVIDEQRNGTQTIVVAASRVESGAAGGSDSTESVDGGPWFPPFFEWGLREAGATYISAVPSSYGDRPFAWNLVFELEDGRWFVPGCRAGKFFTDQINAATQRTGRTIIEFTGDDVAKFLSEAAQN